MNYFDLDSRPRGNDRELITLIMKEQIKQALVANNFSDKESEVYLSVLEFGEATVTRVANRTNIKRTTVYNVMQALSQKGFLSISERKGTQYISALAPALLLDRLENSYKKLKSLNPYIKALMGTAGLRPQIQFFEGIEGIKHCYQQIQTAQGEVIGFTNYDHMPDSILQIIKKNFIPDRKRRKIPARFITPKSEKNFKIAQNDVQNYIQHQQIEKLNNQTSLEFFLFNDRDCVFLSFEKGETFGIMLRSKTIYDMMRTIFDVLWK